MSDCYPAAMANLPTAPTVYEVEELEEILAGEDAVRLGLAAASICVERPGCQPAMPTRAETERRLSSPS